MPNYSNNIRGFGNRSMNNRYVIPDSCNCQNTRNQPSERRCEQRCPAEEMSLATVPEMPLAMAYIPWQKWQYIYDADKALERGTIFEELDQPFEGRGGCKR